MSLVRSQQCTVYYWADQDGIRNPMRLQLSLNFNMLDIKVAIITTDAMGCRIL